MSNYFIVSQKSETREELIKKIKERLRDHKFYELSSHLTAATSKEKNPFVKNREQNNLKNLITFFDPQKDFIVYLDSDVSLETENIKKYIDYSFGKGLIKGNSIIVLENTNEEQIDFLMKSTKKSVCVLLKNKETGLYLGVSRKDNKNSFGFPGGKCEFSETLEEGIKRETKEETGLDITNLKLCFEDFVKKNKVYFCSTFTADYSGEIYTEEKGVVKWVSKQELLDGAFGFYNKKLFDTIKK